MKWTHDKIKECIMNEAPHLWERTTLKLKHARTHKKKQKVHILVSLRVVILRQTSASYKCHCWIKTLDKHWPRRHYPRSICWGCPPCQDSQTETWNLMYLSSWMPPGQHILKDADCVIMLSINPLQCNTGWGSVLYRKI